jgi:hypothetical protein
MEPYGGIDWRVKEGTPSPWVTDLPRLPRVGGNDLRPLRASLCRHHYLVL